MKLKGINNGSKKTINLIKDTFAELLEEKNEINNITVTELVKRANITRGTFYSHYDSIYDVAEEIESELQKIAFSNIKNISSTNDIYNFIDLMFEYLDSNNNLYKKLLQSDAPLFFLNRLNKKFYTVFIETINSNDKELDLKINFFISGALSLIVKYYRNEINYSLDTIKNYLKETLKNQILK